MDDDYNSFYSNRVKTIVFYKVLSYTIQKGGGVMIVRPRYLDILRTYRNVPLVKILAGIRRS
ncbi:MAG: hypothetical protein RSD76_05890, partial [Clostridia bacterium]